MQRGNNTFKPSHVPYLQQHSSEEFKGGWTEWCSLVIGVLGKPWLKAEVLRLSGLYTEF